MDNLNSKNNNGSSKLTPPPPATASSLFGNCKICHDKASGIHYGIASCEGCKGFFKRSITKHIEYVCYFDNKCDMTPEQRKKCKLCRWQACLDAGMSFEGIKMGRIPKNEKERLQLKVETENAQEKSTTIAAGTSKSSAVTNQNKNLFTIKNLIKSSTNKLISNQDTKSLLPNISFLNVYLDTPFESNLIVFNLLRDRAYQLYTEYFNSNVIPYYEKALVIASQPDLASQYSSQNVTVTEFWRAFINYISFMFQVLVKYIIQLPGFSQLVRRDLNLLLKNNIFIVNGILNSKLLIDNEYYLTMPGEVHMSRSGMITAVGIELYEKIINALKETNDIKFTNYELALILPYIITNRAESELQDCREVEKLNDYYKKALFYEMNLNNREKEFFEKFSKLLACFPEINSSLTNQIVDLPE